MPAAEKCWTVLRGQGRLSGTARDSSGAKSVGPAGQEIYPMWNIVIGVIFLIGGLSGKLALRGTGSTTAIAVVGGGLIVWGLIQVANRARE